jgi:hypothetical protein
VKRLRVAAKPEVLAERLAARPSGGSGADVRSRTRALVDHPRPPRPRSATMSDADDEHADDELIKGLTKLAVSARDITTRRSLLQSISMLATDFTKATRDGTELT